MNRVRALLRNKAFMGALAALLIAGAACISQGVSGLPALLSAAQAVFADAMAPTPSADAGAPQ